jgi:hypothetical protein
MEIRKVRMMAKSLMVKTKTEQIMKRVAVEVEEVARSVEEEAVLMHGQVEGEVGSKTQKRRMTMLMLLGTMNSKVKTMMKKTKTRMRLRTVNQK